MQSALARRLVLLLVLVLAGCRSASPGEPASAKRTSVPPPWTAATLESHEYLYIELANGKRGVLFQPQYKTSDSGDYLTSKNDTSVHLTLSEVRVLDAIDGPEKSSGPVVQSVPGILAALWIGALLFLPAIALYLLLK
jgi:hypothetical protein